MRCGAGGDLTPNEEQEDEDVWRGSGGCPQEMRDLPGSKWSLMSVGVMSCQGLSVGQKSRCGFLDMLETIWGFAGHPPGGIPVAANPGRRVARPG